MKTHTFLCSYNTSAVIYTTLNDRGTGNIKSSASVASGDFKISVDGGAFSNLSTPTVSGNQVIVTIAASGTLGRRSQILAVDTATPQTYEDLEIIIETYGHASAAHPTIGTVTLTQAGYLDVAVSSRLASASYVSPPTSAVIATAVWSSNSATNYGGGSFGNLTSANLDTTVSSRLASADFITPPTSTLIASAVWSYDTASVTATALMGGRVSTFLDTTVSSRLPTGSYSVPPTVTQISSAVWSTGSSAFTDPATFGGFIFNSDLVSWGGIADAVWDDIIADHVGLGTFGADFSGMDGNITTIRSKTDQLTFSGSGVWASLTSGIHASVTIPTVTNITNPVTALVSNTVSAVISHVVSASVTAPVTAVVTGVVTLASGVHTGAVIPTVTDVTNMLASGTVSTAVWTASSRALTEQVSGSISGTVTLASGVHTGAVIPTVTTVTNMAATGGIADAVWAAATRSLTEEVSGTISGVVTLASGVHTGAIIPTVTTVVSANLNLAQAVPTTNTAETVGDALNAARADGFGKWVLSGTTLTLYAANGSTVVRTFTLDSGTAPTSRT